MWKQRAVIAAAEVCWAGAIFVTIGGFLGMDNGDGADSVADWTRLNSLLLIAAAVLSVAWIIDRFIVCPRSAYRLGLEAGERRAKRQAAAELVPFPVRHTANGYDRSPTSSW